LSTIATMDAAERNREMAVRRAVGADAAALAAQFAREYGRLFAAGIATGLLGAIAIGAQLKSQLVAVSVSDPIALGGATVLFAVALTAALARPLHRVISANPATLLRQG
jgi:putative ABC transport system permease protein